MRHGERRRKCERGQNRPEEPTEHGAACRSWKPCTRAEVSAGGGREPRLIGDGRGGPGFLESAGNPAGNAGAGEGIRTLDPDLGKVVLYP